MEVVAIVEITLASARVLYQILMFLRQVVQENPQIKVVVRRLVESVRARLHPRETTEDKTEEKRELQLEHVDFLPHVKVSPLRESGQKLRSRFLDTRYLVHDDNQVRIQHDTPLASGDRELAVIEMPVYDWSCTAMT